MIIDPDVYIDKASPPCTPQTSKKANFYIGQFVEYEQLK